MSRPGGVHQRVPGELWRFTFGAGRIYRRVEHALRSVLARENPRPVFVLGNQKSGTTAIAALLGRACGLSVSLDMLQETNFPCFHRVIEGKLSFERYRRRNRFEFSHEIVKEPNLTLLYPFLAEAFPGSEMVFVVRDPRDNIRSQLNRLQIPGDLPGLEAAYRQRLNAGWKLVVDGRWLGIEGDHYVDQLAGRWLHCVRIYRQAADRMRLVRYEDFMADKLGELGRLAADLELPVIEDVRDALDRDFQPRGQRGADWRDFFGAENLARIEKICAEEMDSLGYD